MDVRMLGTGRPFIMEIQNQRAEMPGPEYFASVEDTLQKVECFSVLHAQTCPALYVHVVHFFKGLHSFLEDCLWLRGTGHLHNHYRNAIYLQMCMPPCARSFSLGCVSYLLSLAFCSPVWAWKCFSSSLSAKRSYKL